MLGHSGLPAPELPAVGRVPSGHYIACALAGSVWCTRCWAPLTCPPGGFAPLQRGDLTSAR
jgi:hypothetical protein